MIKATDLIKKETVFKANGHEFNKIKAACSEAAITLYKTKLFAANDPHESTIIIEKYRKLAARFEREFLRANKKPKFIILYGCTELVNMNIFAWDTGFDTPYYENAVFESKEEARKVAESENLQSFVIVEVSNEN